MYLKQRDPLFHTSPAGFDMEDIPQGIENIQAIRATNFIVASTEFMQRLQSETVEPSYIKAKVNPFNKDLIR